MTALGKSSPREARVDRTTWVRDIKTGDVIASSFDQREIEFYLGHIVDDVKVEAIKSGPCEGIEIVMVQTFDGGGYEPLAWIDEPPHSFATDEISDALFPVREAAE